jgi:hypothetical protein
MSPDNVRAFLAIVAVFAVIIGFFIGSVPSEMFSATIGGLIMQFYQAGKVTELSKKVETQEAEIQSLKCNG